MARTPAATSVVSSLFLPPLAYTITAPMQEDDDNWSTTGCKLRKTTVWAFRPHMTRYIPYSYSPHFPRHGHTQEDAPLNHKWPSGSSSLCTDGAWTHNAGVSLPFSFFLILTTSQGMEMQANMRNRIE